MRLASIHVYPVKGARGVALAQADVLPRGLRHDRRFMVVDRDGTFLSQRAHPRLALVDVALGEDGLRLALGTGGSVAVSFHPEGPRRAVRVWDDTVDAVVVPEASGFFSDHLGLACDLVHMPDDVVRPVDPRYAEDGDHVSFADAYPVLLASLASLADLNGRLDAPVPMDRFRPNLVVEGGSAFDEERFPRARVGGVAFRMPKRCSRCEVTLVDQRTAEQGKEPLRTLAKYRSEANKVYFATNLVPDASGTIAVGDEVVYLS